MSETLETMLEAMPDSYQKTVGFPTYDLLAAAAIPMEELEAQQSRQEDLIEYEVYTQSQQYVEDTAKSKLGMAYSDEIIFREKD